MEYIEPNSERYLSLEDLPDEVWKDIKNYEGLYQISDYGRVKSLERPNGNNQYNRESIMRVSITKTGYSFVVLHKLNKCKTFFIHRLVALHFLDNPKNKPLVLHKKAISDGGSNNIDNLYWGTQKENMEDRKRDNHFQVSASNRIRISKRFSKKVNQYDLKGNFIKTWDSAFDMERHLGILNNHIGSCCKGKRKTAGGYIWKYAEEDVNGMVL